MKLFGLKMGSAPFRRREQPSVEVDVEGGGPGNGRKSLSRSMGGGRRRSSLARMKKGIGSFGAVTNNMTNNTSSNLGRSSSSPTSRMSRKSVMRKDKEVDKDTASNQSVGTKN